MDKDDIVETQKHIAETRLVYEKKQREFDGTLARELKKLCWGFSNQYYAYMTLSKNYYVYSDEMYMCTIKNYLSLFRTIKSLHDVPKLNTILLSETQNVITDIERYVDFKTFSANALLAAHPDYNEVIYATGDFVSNQIDAETSAFCKRANSLMEQEDIAEDALTDFCDQFVETFQRYYEIAEVYYTTTISLAEKGQNNLENDGNPDSAEWKDANKRVVEYRTRATLLYKALTAFVIGIFKRFNGLQGIGRTILLTRTQTLLLSFRSIVEYRNKSAKTKLSEWDGYREVWRGSNSIVLLELGAKFDYFHKLRMEKLGKMNEKNIDMKFFTDLCKNYNTLFKMYYLIGIDTYEFQYILVQHYRRFLEDVINIGTVVYPVLFKYSTNNWIICRDLMLKMMASDQISQSVKEDWNKLSVKMTHAIKLYVK